MRAYRSGVREILPSFCLTGDQESGGRPKTPVVSRLFNLIGALEHRLRRVVGGRVGGGAQPEGRALAEPRNRARGREPGERTGRPVGGDPRSLPPPLRLPQRDPTGRPQPRTPHLLPEAARPDRERYRGAAPGGGSLQGWLGGWARAGAMPSRVRETGCSHQRLVTRDGIPERLTAGDR